jgi:urocanate hydratase
METVRTGDRQLETLRVYGGLVEVREDWGGGLALCCGEGCAASGVSVAVSIAGGATLLIDGDAAEVKAAMRRGEIDFVVNTLDEAMRALKNQVRLRRPLSVGLTVEVGGALPEMVERGVLPDVLLIGAKQNADAILTDKSIGALRAMGMGLRSMMKAGDERCGTGYSSKRYEEVFLPAATSVELRAVDERVLAILSADDVVRRRWMQRVGNYIREARNNGGRWVWLTEEERRQICG